MAKSTVDNIVTKIKRRVDYDISDDDLDTLIIDMMNDNLRIIRQWLFNRHLWKEISASTTLATIALQEYVSMATITDFDELIVQSERDQHRTIELVSYEDYKNAFPDPTINTASVPDVAAIWNDKVYFGPTPDSIITIYFDYIKTVTEVASGDDLPFSDKFDPLLIAMCKESIKEWLDDKNSVALSFATGKVADLKKILIDGSDNFGMNRQMMSRRIGGAGPRKQLSSPSYGFGVGGFGTGGFGR